LTWCTVAGTRRHAVQRVTYILGEGMSPPLAAMSCNRTSLAIGCLRLAKPLLPLSKSPAEPGHPREPTYICKLFAWLGEARPTFNCPRHLLQGGTGHQRHRGHLHPMPQVVLSRTCWREREWMLLRRWKEEHISESREYHPCLSHAC
jgi:hypothetical protein